MRVAWQVVSDRVRGWGRQAIRLPKGRAPARRESLPPRGRLDGPESMSHSALAMLRGGAVAHEMIEGGNANTADGF